MLRHRAGQRSSETDVTPNMQLLRERDSVVGQLYPLRNASPVHEAPLTHCRTAGISTPEIHRQPMGE